MGLEPEETFDGDNLEQFALFLEQVLPPLEVRLNYCTINGGDGSAYPAFFKTKEGAERRAKDEEEYGSFCEAAGCSKLVFGLNGDLISGNDYTHCTGDYEEVYE